MTGYATALRFVQSRALRELDGAFAELAADLGVIILRHATPGGLLPDGPESVVLRNALRARTNRFFATPDRRPYSDGIVPTAPLPRILNEILALATWYPVQLAHDYMALHAEPDVWAWLSQGEGRAAGQSWSGAPARIALNRVRTRSDAFPGTSGANIPAGPSRRPGPSSRDLRHVAELEPYDPLFVDPSRLDYDPLHRFVAPHKWVDPRGYRLSARIWQNGMRTRQKIDRIVQQGIMQGQGALLTARELEQAMMLQPGRDLIITRKPYGTKVNYDAMRLARTETTAAFGRATMAAARANPFVNGIRWNLSGSHPDIDPCDQRAGDYTLRNVPLYPEHPQCLCFLTPIPIPAREVNAAIRARIRAERPAPATPAAMNAFLAALGVAALMNYLPNLAALAT